MTTLATIGYEGAALAYFIATLKRAGIEQVIDIRDVPVSRRPGFSKNILAKALSEDGISYLHLKALGDPKPGRVAAREGRHADFRLIYSDHMSKPAGQEALQVACEAAKEKVSTLLCFERDPEHCHRTLVADAMSSLSSFKVRNLGVQKHPRSGAREAHVKNGSGAVEIAIS